MTRARMKLVSVRFSEDEYESLKQLCGLQGSGSISNLVRSSMRWIAANGTRSLLDAVGDGSLTPPAWRNDPMRTVNLEQRLERLDRELQTLKGLFERTTPTARS